MIDDIYNSGVTGPVLVGIMRINFGVTWFNELVQRPICTLTIIQSPVGTQGLAVLTGLIGTVRKYSVPSDSPEANSSVESLMKSYENMKFSTSYDVTCRI